MMSPNDYNFSPGPGALPGAVLERIRDAIIAVPETGLSVLGMSHRSPWFAGVVAEAKANIRTLLSVPADYEILFMQGGSSLQFSSVPMSFGAPGRPAAYAVTGYWGKKAFQEGARMTDAHCVWSGEAGGFRAVPTLDALIEAAAGSSFLHFVSNETVEGVQFPALDRRTNLTVVCDMSSDFLSRPVEVANYDLIYAHAQKNLGPAGITVVVISKALLDRVPDGLPVMLDYRVQAQHDSIYNTPPTFAIYVLMLVTRWMRDDIGGVAEMAAINRRKAGRLYETLGRLDNAVELHADAACRSDMNVVAVVRDAAMQKEFLTEAKARGFVGLEGHRSVGGLRASLYNAVTEEAVADLCAFIDDFFQSHG